MWEAGGGGKRCPVSGWSGDDVATGVESQGYSGRWEMSRIWWLTKGRRRRGTTTGF
jgi:hypothetical protein